jgi:predicted DNA-binding protein
MVRSAKKRSTISKRVGRGADQLLIRLPGDMRQRIASLAADNGRSMNAEIVAALEKHLESGDAIVELWARVEKLESKVHDHDVTLYPGDHLD